MAVDWRTATLGEVLGKKGYIRGPFGSALKRGDLLSEGVPVYEQQHAIYSTRKFRFFIGKEKYRELARFTVQPNDLIVSCSGTLGRVSVIRDGDPIGVISQALLILRPDTSHIDSRFLFYILSSPAGFHSMVSVSTGSVQVNIAKRSIIESIEIKLPPVSEQKAIAAVLGALDDKIELNQRMNATLETMARALFQSWFVDFDSVRAKVDGLKPAGMDAATASLFPAAFQSSKFGPIPAGWGHTTLAEICSKITDGAHQSPKSVDAGLPMASVKDMTDWEINIPSCRHISDVDFASLVANGCQPELGDILLAKDGATCLDTACEYRQNETIVLLSSVAILRPRQPCDSAFLHTWLGLSSTKTYLKENFISGSAIPRVVLRDIKRAQLISPPRKILDAFSRAVAPLREQIRHNHDQSRTLATLRDTLLPKLLSGELSVDRMTDERSLPSALEAIPKSNDLRVP